MSASTAPVADHGQAVGPVVEAEAVSFAYGAEQALVDVSLRVGPGEFVALVGPNGSGKSTLVRLLLGLLEPDAGAVRLFGKSVRQLRERWRVGYVPQRPVAINDLPATVREVVSAGRLGRSGWHRRLRTADWEAIDHAIEEVDLVALRHRRLGELSGGQQQRVFIARALAAEPDLLVADEPVAGVDAESQRRFRDSLSHLVLDHGGAVLLVSHELGAVADDLDRIVVLKQSVVFDGPPSELAATGVSLGVHAEDLPLWLERLH